MNFRFTLPDLRACRHTQMGALMSINISAKTDYSFLFSGMSSASGGSSLGNLNFLSDYASIKNGSYGKLMKAYFSQNTSKEVSSLANKTVDKRTNSTSVDTTKKLAKMQSTTDELKESADALLATGSKSVFKDGAVTEDAYKAVSAFVNDYNAVLSASDEVSSSSILTRTASLVKATESNEGLLAKVGITIGEDNSLSIDKDTFMKADVSTVKSLFNGSGSYAYRVSAQASLINFAADNEAAKANTYNFNGSYSNNYTQGSIFNSFF